MCIPCGLSEQVNTMEKFAIIGFGAAGYSAARELRRRCPRAQIDVYERTGHGVACPILTTYYSEKRIEFDGMFPYGNIESLCAEHRLGLIPQRVVRLDPAKRVITAEDGVYRRYDAILVSSGASAVKPRFIRIEDGRQVFLMRTVRDAVMLREYLDAHEVESAAVVGASMVGIKVAEIFQMRSIPITLLDAAPHMFPLNAYEETALKIQAMLEQQGIRVRMDAAVSQVVRDGIVPAAGELIRAEVVCLCVGIRANLDMLAPESLLVGKGIVVDEHMQSSCPGVYAAGDCCEGQNLQTGKPEIIGLWANAHEQGKCAAANMAGQPVRCYGTVPNNIARFLGIVFVGIGDPAAPGQRRLFRSDNAEVDVCVDGDRIVSMNILGNCTVNGTLKSLLIKQLLVEDRRLSDIQRGLIRRAGLPESFIRFVGGDGL